MCTIKEFYTTLDLTPDEEMLHITNTEKNFIKTVVFFYNVSYCNHKNKKTIFLNE